MQQVNLPKQNKPTVSSPKNDPVVTDSSQAPQQNANQDQNSNNNNPTQQDQQNNKSMNSQNPNRQNRSRQRPPKDDFSDPWGSAWDDPWGSKPQENEKKLTPQERTEMITKVYMDVLGREPDTRDINYYKYSTLGEDEIYKQILTGKEHKKLIADGKDFKNMNTRASQAEVRVKVLEGQIKDQVVEFRQLTELLQEKNRYINQLRSSSQNPYSFTTDTVDNVRQGHMHYSQEHKAQDTQNNTQQRMQSTTPKIESNNQSSTQPPTQMQTPQQRSQSSQPSQSPQVQTQPSQLNRQQSPQQSSNTANVQFGNAQLDTTVPPKKNKVKEFLKTVLDL